MSSTTNGKVTKPKSLTEAKRGPAADRSQEVLEQLRQARQRMREKPRMPFDVVESVWRQLFPHLSTDIGHVTLGAWLANHKQLGFTDPCWLTIIAPSSSAKTVILAALSDATKGYIVDTLTPQTLVSGLRLGKRRNFGLLQRLGKYPNIIIKDLSGMLTKNAKDRQELIGQLRAVYDGEFARPTGAGADDDLARWRGRATLTVGMTPAIDLYHALNNQLGERFIQLRFQIAEEDVVAVGGQALENEEKGRSARKSLAAAFGAAITAATPLLSRSVLTPEMRLRLQNLVAFVSKARAGVMRDRSGTVLQPPAPEGPGRLIKQLAALGCGLAALRGTSTMTETDYKLVERVAFNSIPEPRGSILWALYDKGAGLVADFRNHVPLTVPTIRRHLEDLELLGLVEVEKGGDGKAGKYRPSALGLKYLDAARDVESGKAD